MLGRKHRRILWRNPAIALLLSLTLVLSAAAPVDAQPPSPVAELPEIRAGTPVPGALSQAQVDELGRSYQDYRLELTEREIVQIDLESPRPGAPVRQVSDDAPAGFDPYIEIRRPGGTSQIAGNDDRPGSLNSRLVFTAPATGTFIVRARAFYRGEGEYLLTVTRLANEPEPIPLSGNRAEGRMGAGNPTREEFDINYRYALYSFDGRAGDRVRLSLGSPAGGNIFLYDAERRLLAVGLTGNRTSAALAILPRTERYLIRVDIPAASEETYTVDLTQVPSPPPPQVRPIRIGELVEGRLSLESSGASVPPNRAGAIEFFYELYSVQVSAGQVVTITLDAQGFDPMLDAGASSVLGFAVAANDDDSGDGLNSRLVLRPALSGRLDVRVRSLGQELGSYGLRVSDGDQPPPEPAAPVPR